MTKTVSEAIRGISDKRAPGFEADIHSSAPVWKRGAEITVTIRGPNFHTEAEKFTLSRGWKEATARSYAVTMLVQAAKRHARGASLIPGDPPSPAQAKADAMKLIASLSDDEILRRISPRKRNPADRRLVDAIGPGDRVTIVDRFGKERSGKAVMRSSHGGWVLNMGGAHGTPGIADDSNITRVSKSKKKPSGAALWLAGRGSNPRKLPPHSRDASDEWERAAAAVARRGKLPKNPQSAKDFKLGRRFGARVRRDIDLAPQEFLTRVHDYSYGYAMTKQGLDAMPTREGRNYRKRNPVSNRNSADSFQAITVKRFPASNVKGARWKATTASGISLTLSDDDALDNYGNAVAAAEALAAKLKWHGEMVGGSTRDGYAFTFRELPTRKQNPFHDDKDAALLKSLGVETVPVNSTRRAELQEQGWITAEIVNRQAIMYSPEAAKSYRRNPADAWVIALYMKDKDSTRLTYDANRRRFSDNSKPALYRTQLAAKEKAESLIKAHGGMLSRFRVTVEPAKGSEAGAVFGARPRQRNPKLKKGMRVALNVDSRVQVYKRGGGGESRGVYFAGKQGTVKAAGPKISTVLFDGDELGTVLATEKFTPLPKR